MTPVPPVSSLPFPGQPVSGPPFAVQPVSAPRTDLVRADPVRADPVRTASSGPIPAARPGTLVPVSGVPVSGIPVSGIPVSGVPVSGVPVSGAPVSGAAMPGVVGAGGFGAGGFTAQPGGDGTSSGGLQPTRPVSAARRARRFRPLNRLRVGTHGVSRAAFQHIDVPGMTSGVMLGHDGNKAPVLIRMFRDEPTRVSLVGGLWAARVAVFRALAMGARVVVFTAQPAEWQGFGRWATGRDDRVAVMSGERPVTVGATATAPALLLYDVGLSGASRPPALGPWQTQLTVLRTLTAYGFPPVQASNMVLLQRLASSEAHAAASVLKLTAESVSLLQVLRDDMLAALGGQADRYLWLNPTQIESQQFGAPHR